MSGILRLESLTKGNTLKQGDKTPLKYRLFDADGEKLNIAGKSAKVRLVYPDFLTIGYERDGLTVAQDDTVTFTIDRAIPARIYHVEIIVDGQFVFPSRADEAKFTVDKSSLGADANIIEIVGKDVLIQEVKSQVDTELQPLVTSLESAQQAETQRATAESSRVSAEVQRKIDHANRSAELAGKADKVVIENLIENGDFATQENWVIQNATIEHANNKLTVTGDGTLDYPQVYQNRTRNTQHKYYVRAVLEKIDTTIIEFRMSTSTFGASPIIKTVGADTEYILSGVIENPGDFLRIYGSYPTGTSNGKSYAVLKVLEIDLTETFGAGNEPTKEEMDELVEVTGYIDSENGLNVKDMLGYLMNSKADRSTDLASKADKVVIKNLIENGDFSDGLNGWQHFNLNAEVVNGKVKATMIDTNASPTGTYFGKSGINLYKDHEYYIQFEIEPTKETLTGVFLNGNWAKTERLPVNELSVHSVILVSTSTKVSSSPDIRINHRPDGDYVNGDTFTLDNVMMIDLTETFGAGNEPTKEEMDEFIKVTGYIDGEYAINNKEMLGRLMKGIREKANKKQEDWITPTLLNGAINHGDTFRYRKTTYGTLQFKGAVSGLKATTYFMVLPTEYRVSTYAMMGIAGGVNKTYIVLIDGNMPNWGTRGGIGVNGTVDPTDRLYFDGVEIPLL